jgi:hypothetical protein
MDSANPVNRTWVPSVSALYRSTTQTQGCQFVAALQLDPVTVSQYGGATGLWLTLTIDGDASTAAPTVGIEVSMFNKTATRLAESSWLKTQINVGDNPSGQGWALDVLGYPVDPLSVVPMGTKHTHAVDSGVTYNANGAKAGAPVVNITTLDAFLVAPGDHDHLLWYDGLTDPDLSTGAWYWNLHNNVWGTAFAQWYGAIGPFGNGVGLWRFVITLQA